MKKMFFMAFVVAALCSLSTDALGQKSDKDLKKDLRAKVERDCVKTAKQLTKEGWKVMPGKLPLARQIQDARFAELDTDTENAPLNFVGTHTAIGGNYSAAKQICDARAYAEIAQQVSNQVAKQVKDQLASRNLGDGDLELVDETMSAAKTTIAAQLQGVKPVMEIYKDLDLGKYEVRVVVIVNYKATIKAAKAALYTELKGKNEALAQEVSKM